MINLYLAVIDNDESISKFEKIYNTYHDIMLKITFSITKNELDAEEALQEAFFTIAETIDKINTNNPDMLKSYLYIISKNEAIDVLKRKKKSKITLDINDIPTIVSDEDINSIISGNEQYKAIIKQIEKMPVAYKDVLILYFVREMSASQIARILKRSKNTVKSQLSRGTKILRVILKEEGFYDEHPT